MTICRYISIQTVIILRDRVICSSSVYPAAAVDAKGFSSLCRITELLPRTKYGNRGNFYYMNFSVVQSLQLLVLVLVWQRCGSKQQQQQLLLLLSFAAIHCCGAAQHSQLHTHDSAHNSRK